jgi:hypothetical protein
MPVMLLKTIVANQDMLLSFRSRLYTDCCNC